MRAVALAEDRQCPRTVSDLVVEKRTDGQNRCFRAVRRQRRSHFNSLGRVLCRPADMESDETRIAVTGCENEVR